MLYPKSKDPFLKDETFQNPGSEYRGAPFWAWNCELEKKELLWQLDVLKKMGLGGAHMHVRTGMATPYLSDEHMSLIKACVEKCRQEEMHAWLYDEDRWPSGAAGGIVTKDHRYRARYLMFTPRPYQGQKSSGVSHVMDAGSSRSDNGALMACYDVVLDENGCLVKGKRISPEDEAEGTKWYAYMETPKENPWYNNQTYVNTLDKAAIRRFIEVTYERYLETIGDDFGGIVPAIFTDEPQFTRKQTLSFASEKRDVILPWTDDVPDTFRKAYGEDILEHLPELFWELPDGMVSTIRYHYHDHISERFTQAFADQCGSWCKDHGLMLTGHMMEEPSLRSQTSALGEAMRSYRSFQLPGIDMLCNGTEFTTAKQAQSASRQYGREGVLSELYGVTGWDFDFRGHKFQGDWQAALGVTVRVHHLSWVSMKGEAKRDYPASINYQTPWWRDYSMVEDHFARVNTALTRGKAEVRVGVIHPVESFWLHWGPAEQTGGIRAQLEENFQNITSWLLNSCIDFDFISESLLPELCGKGAAPLSVGEMAYDAILVPACETLRSTTLERLEAFAEAGGQLIFLGDAPKYENAVPNKRGYALWKKARHIPFQKESIMKELEAVRLVDIRNENGTRTGNLIYQLRRDGDTRWLFIAHSYPPFYRDAPNSQLVHISLSGAYSVTKYDTQSGKIIPLDAHIEGGKTKLTVRLHDLDSLLLRYTAPTQVTVQNAPPAQSKRIPLPVPAITAYTLDEPNVYLLDKAEFALDDEQYRPQQELLRADNVLRATLGWPNRMGAVAQPWVIQEKKPEHTVRLRFHVQCAVDIPDVKLALEDAPIARILCNGTQINTSPDGWFTDKSIGTVPIGALRQGENIIEVTLPFGCRTNVEWCYLLGDFGVRVLGEYRELIPVQSVLGFDDVTKQGLAHYGGNITYHIPVTTTGGRLRITAPHFAGTAIRVELGDRKEYIAYPPYVLELDNVPAGEHMLDLTLLGNRQNCFGPMHLANLRERWIGPDAWRSRGDRWTESYRLRELGILSTPIIEEVL